MTGKTGISLKTGKIVVVQREKYLTLIMPNSPRLIMVQSDPPDGPGGYPRQAVVDFSGVGLRAGVRFYF
jgi:hypothetical protein